MNESMNKQRDLTPNTHCEVMPQMESSSVKDWGTPSTEASERYATHLQQGEAEYFIGFHNKNKYLL